MKKILIIDDDLGILGALTAILELEKIVVTTSTNSGFLDKLDKNSLPDLILLDLFVAGENGKQILGKIKKNGLTKKIPVIMLSAYPNVREDIIKSGADDFIAKPFDMEDLLSKVKQYL